VSVRTGARSGYTIGVEWELLAGLEDEEQRRVLASCVRRRFPRGQVVFHEGEPGESMHLLERGRACVRMSTGLGESITVAVLGPGNFFGEQALVSSTDRRSGTVEALEPVETLALTRSRFDELRRDHPEVNDLLVRALDARLREIGARLVEALSETADKRVLRRLADLAEIYGPGTPTTIVLTQDDLATMAGTTRPTANRVLRGAQDRGVIDLARGRIEILDLDQLRRMGL